MFECRALKLNADPTKNYNWVRGHYVKYLPITPEAIWPNEKEERERYQAELDAMTKHYVFHEGFSDWNMPCDLEKDEIDIKTLHYKTGIKAPYRGYKGMYPIFQGDIVAVGDDESEELGVVVWCKNLSSFVVVPKDDIKYDGVYPILNVENAEVMLSIVSDVMPLTIVGTVFDKLKGKKND
jgi:hypothetical protein